MKKNIPLVFLLDVDGVMTNGQFIYSNKGKIQKIFGPDDHDGLSLLSEFIEIRFVTGDRKGFDISKKRIVDDMGFKLDLVTPTGAPAIIEQWAMPNNDKSVAKLFAKYDDALAKPNSLIDFAKNSLIDESPYIGVFIPGGHGAILGLPNDPNLGKILRWAQKKDIHIITLCHGPGTLMSAKIDSDFIFNGYEIALFPDSVDKQTPVIGYLPGHMPFELGEKLKELGMHIINKKADDTCHIDRNLITGASPYASNKLGRLAAETLLKVVN